MPRKVQQIPGYFTPEEAAALVEGAPSYPTPMAFRIMLKSDLGYPGPWRCDVWTCAWTSTR